MKLLAHLPDWGSSISFAWLPSPRPFLVTTCFFLRFFWQNLQPPKNILEPVGLGFWHLFPFDPKVTPSFFFGPSHVSRRNVLQAHGSTAMSKRAEAMSLAQHEATPLAKCDRLFFSWSWESYFCWNIFKSSKHSFRILCRISMSHFWFLVP